MKNVLFYLNRNKNDIYLNDPLRTYYEHEPRPLRQHEILKRLLKLLLNSLFLTRTKFMITVMAGSPETEKLGPKEFQK